MGEGTRNNYNRNRNTAYLLIGTGVYLLIEHIIGLYLVIAILLIALGIYQMRVDHKRKGYILIGIGVIFVLLRDVSILLAIVLIIGGYFYFQSRKVDNRNPSVQKKHSIIDSIKWGHEPWPLQDSSVWFVFGEVNLDLTTAIFVQEETTILVQGVIGDIDITIPEEIGVWIDASLAIGPIDAVNHNEHGMMSKVNWQSSNYATSSNRVKLIISFIVGDIDIKILN
ncbi:cell wall-active antibiotics response protein LiaF [Paenibacillus albiflavus]|nr:cell wall-active antibiotics response protein LiaF [Paenibacillus albiflavus]